MPFFNNRNSASQDMEIDISPQVYDSVLPAFSTDLCVFSSDVKAKNVELEDNQAALLINIAKSEVVYAKNAFKKMYPASITKILTALVALNHCTPDETIVCTKDVEEITVPGAVLLGLKEGDTLTLDQALRLCLLSSYNDVAVAIAVHVAGSVEAFSDMMNETAASLGATGSHFVNPSGLPDDDHYTTAYDIYLIFNHAIANDNLYEILQMKTYETVYHDSNNNIVNAQANNTNRYFTGNYTPPDNITIIGGKTGTTSEAGSCLAIVARDNKSTPYIAVVLKAENGESLYTEMTSLLAQISN